MPRNAIGHTPLTKSLKKRKTTLFLIIFPLFSSVLSHFFDLKYIWSVLLFFIIPSVVLIVQIPQYLPKISFFAFICLPFLIMIDFLAHFNGAWLVNSLFSYRLFGQVPYEDIAWGFFTIFFIIAFYKYYLDKKAQNVKLFHKKLIPLIIVFAGFPFVWFVLGFLLSEKLFQLPYSYLWIGIIGSLLPLLYIFYKRPQYIMKYFFLGLYFLYHTLVYELTALDLGWWAFPASSQFLGWIEILHYRFPLEEFVFWMLTFAVTGTAYYEYFDEIS